MEVSSGRTQARVFYAILALYLVATFSLSSRYQYSLYPDATSYLSIAQAYARGQFWDAVNGYWAPLYCWLLALPIAAGVELLVAPKLVALLIGTLAFAGLRRLCRRLRLSDRAIIIVLIAALPAFVSWSLTLVTPDFLLVAVLTWYLSEVVAWTPSSGIRSGLAAGALAGLASLSKQYALPFVASHLVLAAALHYHQRRTPNRRATLGSWLIAAYIVLFAIMGPWIATMSAKYGRLTIAASGQYNWYLLQTGFNVGTRSLAPPPFPGAASGWVDPTPYAHTAPSRVRVPANTPGWGVSPWSAPLVRVLRITVMLEQFSLLAFPILLAAGVLAHAQADYRYLQLGLALVLYIAGYQAMTAWFVERLMWIVPILVCILGALVFERLTAADRIRPRAELASAMLLILSFWALPILRLAQGLDEGRELHATAQLLERDGVRGRLASLNRYADSLRVALLTGSAYYGRIAPPTTMEIVISELQSNEVDFLLIWTEKNPENSPDLYRELAERFPDSTRGQIRELSALDVRGLTSRPATERQ
jgi:4-amino-4-deoxy-L-arabinose transferase-like glycosyltransferase